MSDILVILFDIGNVLMLADHRRTIEAYILRYGLPREFAENYFERPDYAAIGRVQLYWAEYCQRLRNEWQCRLDNDEIQEIDALHIYAVDLGLLALVEQLKAQIKVGFVTNTRYPEWERYCQLEPRFQTGEFSAWRSDKYRHYKNEPGVFRDIIDRWVPENLGIAVRPSEVMFVDDSPGNCEAASNIGVQVFRYTERQPWELERRLAELGFL